jgi:hypothetical protein
MCTVTYLPLENDGFILTSNRDESPMRKQFHQKNIWRMVLSLLTQKTN